MKGGYDMVFRIENSEIVINGKSIFKAIIGAYIAAKLCRTIFKIEKKNYYILLDNKTKRTKKELKSSDNNQKAESK